MPPIQFNPKYKIYNQRLQTEGVTNAGRSMTDDFIEEELPNFAKPMTKDIVGGYRSVVDFPTDAFRMAFGFGLLYVLFVSNR